MQVLSVEKNKPIIKGDATINSDNTITIRNTNGASSYVYYNLYDVKIGDKVTVEFDMVETTGENFIQSALGQPFSPPFSEFARAKNGHIKFVFYIRKNLPDQIVSVGHYTEKITTSKIKNLSIRIDSDCGYAVGGNITEVYRNYTFIIENGVWTLRKDYNPIHNCKLVVSDSNVVFTHDTPFTAPYGGIVIAEPSATGNKNYMWRVKSNTYKGFALEVYDVSNNYARVNPNTINNCWISFRVIGYDYL